MTEFAVAVIDIGSPAKENLGWAFKSSDKSAEGSDLDECIGICGEAFRAGPLALGFEAPLFVPMRTIPQKLTGARTGECANGVNRPFSANAGAAALVTALVVVPYVLSGLRKCIPNAAITLDWRSPPKENSLMLFEAFVTNRKKSGEDRHIADAKCAIEAFCHGMKNPTGFQSSIDEPACFNLLSAALLRSGWTTDIELLSESCLVVRA